MNQGIQGLNPLIHLQGNAGAQAGIVCTCLAPFRSPLAVVYLKSALSILRDGDAKHCEKCKARWVRPYVSRIQGSTR